MATRRKDKRPRPPASRIRGFGLTPLGELANLRRSGKGKPPASVDDDRRRQAEQKARANARRRARAARTTSLS